MPSFRTRIAVQNIVLATAQQELVEAAAAVSDATDLLEDLQAGVLDVDAITVGGQQFINDGGTLVVAP